MDKVQNDGRLMTVDISRLKSQLEETTDGLEAYKRDCKKMNEEIIGLQVGSRWPFVEQNVKEISFPHSFPISYTFRFSATFQYHIPYHFP